MLRRNIHKTTINRSLWSDWFSSKTKQSTNDPKESKKNIVDDQNNFEVAQDAKIKFYGKHNSPEIERFDIKTHMPGFKISQWKSQTISTRNLEHAFTEQHVTEVISSIYAELNRTSVDFDDMALDDLHMRFSLVKRAQAELGIDIPDLELTKAHTATALRSSIMDIIAKRFKYERNPNDINLRQSDFDTPTIHVSSELDQAQQSKRLQHLVKKARQSS